MAHRGTNSAVSESTFCCFNRLPVFRLIRLKLVSGTPSRRPIAAMHYQVRLRKDWSWPEHILLAGWAHQERQLESITHKVLCVLAHGERNIVAQALNSNCDR